VFPFIVFFLAALATVIAALKLQAGEPGGMATRLPAIIGACMVLFSFAFLPWAKFSPGSYVLDLTPELLGDYVPKALTGILKLLGQQGLAKGVSLLESLVGIPAWILLLGVWPMALFVSPSYWPMTLALTLVPLVGVATIVWLAATLLFTIGSDARRKAGRVQAIAAAVSGLLLLAQMPVIDALGSAGTLVPRFLLTLGGARMSSNVWMAWWGLVLIAIGGLLEMMAHPGSRRVQDGDSFDWQGPDEYVR
jgi:hypothetical protein